MDSGQRHPGGAAIGMEPHDRPAGRSEHGEGGVGAHHRTASLRKARASLYMSLFFVLMAQQCVGAGAGPREWARGLMGLINQRREGVRGEALLGERGGQQRVQGGRRLLMTASIDTIVPSKGPVHGWTTVTVQGEGFTSHGDYSLVFSAGAQSKSVPLSTFKSSSKLTFVTPAWYDRGDDSYPAATTNVTLRWGGNQSLSLPAAFNFEPVWEAQTMSPTVGSVLGGSTITLTGYGFSERDVYFCSFERFEGPVLPQHARRGALVPVQMHGADNPARCYVPGRALKADLPDGVQVSTHREFGRQSGSVSDTEVICKTPLWDFDARIATVTLMRVPEAANPSMTLAESVAVGVNVLSHGLVNYFEFQEAWFRLSPTEGGSVGGAHLVTLYGQGFDRRSQLLFVSPLGGYVRTTEREYLVTFTATDGLATTVACPVHNHSELHCTTPSWPGLSVSTRVSLARRWLQWSPQDFPTAYKTRSVTENLTTTATGNGDYVFLPEATSIDPVWADRHSVSVITVSGLGFTNESDYTCRLTDAGNNVTELNATWVSASRLECGWAKIWDRWNKPSADLSPQEMAFALLADLLETRALPQICENVSSFENVSRCVNETIYVNLTNGTEGLLRFVDGNGTECSFVNGEWQNEYDENCTETRDNFFDWFDENGTRCFLNDTVSTELWNDTDTSNDTVSEDGVYLDRNGNPCIQMWVNQTDASNVSLTFQNCSNYTDEVIEESCVDPPENFVLSPTDLKFDFVFVNKPPSFRARNLIVSGLDNAGEVFNVSWLISSSPGTLANGSDAHDEWNQEVTIVIDEVGPPAFFSSPPVIDGTNLVFSVFPHKSGTASIRVHAVDDGGTLNGGKNSSGVQTYYVTVKPFSRAPTFDLLDDIEVFENSGFTEIVAFAQNLSNGNPNSVLQALDGFRVSLPPSKERLFATLPQIHGNGSLTFEVAPFEYGDVEVNVTLALLPDDFEGPHESSSTVRITVVSINQAPSFELLNASLTLDEVSSSGISQKEMIAVSVVAGPPQGNEDDQSMTFSVVLIEGNASLFTPTEHMRNRSQLVDLDVETGELIVLLAPHAFGNARFEVILSDNGGTEHGGEDTSPPQYLQVQVLPVNDQPSFKLPFTIEVDESEESWTFPGFATNISVGGLLGNEDDQRLTFHVEFLGGNENLFATRENDQLELQVSNEGVLYFATVPFEYGNATFEVYLRDDGGTARGGVDTSESAEFTILVNPVNDPPSFDVAQGVQIWEYTEAAVEQISAKKTFSFDLFASNISRGSPTGNEDDQQVEFRVVFSCGDAALLEAVSLSPDGTLAFRSAAFASGAANFTASLVDSGGTDRGGVNISTAKMFSIVVLPVNNPPSFKLTSDIEVLESAGTVTLPGFAQNISAGSPLGDEDGQELSFLVSFVSGDRQLFDGNGGVFPVLTRGGMLNYTLVPFEHGSATLNVSLVDDGGSERGGVNGSTVSQMFRISVLPVNNKPSFDVKQVVSIWEDSTDVMVPDVCFNMFLGSPTGNEDHQNYHFYVDIAPGNETLFDEIPEMFPNGTLSVSLADSVNGNATFTVTMVDDGGTAHSGNDTSVSKSFVLHILSVNDRPAFTVSDLTLTQGQGNVSLPNFAHEITTGPVYGDEVNQAVTFTINFVSGNQDLFIPQSSGELLSISPDGRISLELDPLHNGEATFQATLQDAGGTVRGGVNTADAQTFAIFVHPRNRAPEFSSLEEVVTLETNDAAGAMVFIDQFAKDIHPGSDNGNEDHQELTFKITLIVGDPGLFVLYPNAQDDGILNFTLAPYAYGTARFSIFLEDDGPGGFAGNVNSSEVRYFDVRVLPVNNPPSFDALGDVEMDEDHGCSAMAGFVRNISRGAPTGNEDMQNMTFFIHSLTFTGETIFASLPPPQIDVGGDACACAEACSDAPIFLSCARHVDGVMKDQLEQNCSARWLDNSGLPCNSSIPVECEPNGTNTVGNATRCNSPDPNKNCTLRWLPGPPESMRWEKLGCNCSLLNQPRSSVSTDLVRVSSTGTLSFSVIPNANGAATLSIGLRDDGGLERGGKDTSALTNITITVAPVNDAPSFALTDGRCFTPNVTCRGDLPLIMIQKNQFLSPITKFTLPGFAVNMSVGPINEADQSWSFTIEPASDVESVLVADLHLSQSGTLTFVQKADISGKSELVVRMTDSGSGVSPSVNSAPELRFLIFVVGGVVEARYSFSDRSLADVDINSLLNAISVRTGIPVNEMEIEVLSAGLETGAQRRLLGASLELLVRIYSVSSDPAVLSVLAQEAANLDPAVVPGLSDSSTIQEQVDALVTGSFDVTDSLLVANEDDGSVLITDFVLNVSATGMPISDSGGQVVVIDLELLNASAPLNDLFAVPPAIASLILTDDVQTADLSFTPAHNMSGTATFAAHLSRTNAVRTFVVTILPVNDPPAFKLSKSKVVFREDSGNISLSSLFEGITTGPADEEWQHISAQIAVVHSTGPLFVHGDPINAWYNNVQLDAMASSQSDDLVFMIVTLPIRMHAFYPHLQELFRKAVAAAARTDDSKVLIVSLSEEHNATDATDAPALQVEFLIEVTSEADEIALAANLTIRDINLEILALASTPSRSLPEAVLTRSHLFPYEAWNCTINATDADNSTDTTDASDLYFDTNGVECDLSLPPCMKSDTGVWVLQNDPDEECTLAFLDVDGFLCVQRPDGNWSTADGVECSRGKYSVRATSIGAVSAQHYALREAQSLSEARSSVSRRLLGVDNSMLDYADEVVESWESGSLDLSWILEVDPEIRFGTERNGSLELAFRPFVAGNFTLELWLEDSGGTVRGGTNRTQSVFLDVSVTPWNHPPTFDMATDRITILEDCQDPTHGDCFDLDWSMENFTTEMRTGPSNERQQGLTFHVLPDLCQVPYHYGGMWQDAFDSFDTGCAPDLSFPGVAPSPQQLFTAPVILDMDGKLQFALKGDRHGQYYINFELVDDGDTCNGGDPRSITRRLLLEVLSVNDAPSLTFYAHSLNITSGCVGYAPAEPYPNGWTWSSDPDLCETRRGLPSAGCWMPLWSCEYDTTFLKAVGGRRLLAAEDSAANSTNTSTEFLALQISLRGEVLLFNTGLQAFIQNQTKFRAAVAESLTPLADVNSSSVNITNFFNFSGASFARRTARSRSLLATPGEGPGLAVLFNIDNVTTLQSADWNPEDAQSGLIDRLRTSLELTFSVLVTVVRADVFDLALVPVVDAVAPSASTCVNPPLLPRPQCQDGLFVMDDFVSVTHAAWGEEEEQVWVVATQTSGPSFGNLRISFPILNSTRDAQVVVAPLPGRFGAADFDVCVYDSGGTDHGGVDRDCYPGAISLLIPGTNVRPAFSVTTTLVITTQDAACVEYIPGQCDGTCAGGVPECVGGSNPTAVCSNSAGCLGNCTGGAFIPRAVSCLGDCSCDARGTGSCSASGICECDAANTGATCSDASDCTGGGTCFGKGICVAATDSGAPCTPFTVCSNRGYCKATFLQYRRHQILGLAYGITAGAPSEDGGDSCPPGTSIGNGCVSQVVSFTLTSTNSSIAGELFTVLPFMTADGTLIFNLTSGKAGEAEFGVVLKDDSGDPETDSTEPIALKIRVNPLNEEPTFTLPDSVTVFEDSGRYFKPIAIDISSPNAAGGSLIVTFSVRTGNPTIFLTPPEIFPNGTLAFVTAPNASGVSDVTVTMTDRSRPSAGMLTVTRTMAIYIQAVDDVPYFNVVQGFVSLPTNSELQHIKVVSGISAGSDIEDCEPLPTADCRIQNLTFVVESISDPSLFSILPSVSTVTGELLLKPAADTSGVSVVRITLVDDGRLNTNATPGCVHVEDTAWGGRVGNGVNAQCLIGNGPTVGQDTSDTVSLLVEVLPGAPQTDVRLLYDVDCGNVSTADCTCEPMWDTPHLTIQFISYNTTEYSNRTVAFNRTETFNQTVIINVTTYKMVENFFNFSNISSIQYLADVNGTVNGTNATNATMNASNSTGNGTNTTSEIWITETIGGIYLRSNFSNVSEIIPVNFTEEVSILVTDYYNVTDEFIVTRTVPEHWITYETLHSSDADGNLVVTTLMRVTSQRPSCLPAPGGFADGGPSSLQQVVPVRVQGDQGPQRIDNFAAVLREKHFLPASVATLVFPAREPDQNTSAVNASSLVFLERSQHRARLTAGLEYASNEVISADGRFAYFPEPETSSISVWARDPEEGNLSFISRRAHGERRVRFQSADADDDYDMAPTEVRVPNICDVHALSLGDARLLAIASGCAQASMLPEQSWPGNRSIPTVAGASVLAHWDFEAVNLYGAHALGYFAAFGSRNFHSDPNAKTCSAPHLCVFAYEATGNVTCTDDAGCTYERPAISTPDCREPAGGLRIYPSTVRDGGGGLGAALFSGPKCRVQLGSQNSVADWLAADLSPVNFIINNGKYEAMQFDGAMNPGLFITGDIRTLLDADPTKSKMPTHAISVEAWVTVDKHTDIVKPKHDGVIIAAASGVHGGIRAAAQCQKGWMLTHTFAGALTSSGSSLTFSFAVSVEKSDPNGLGLFTTASVVLAGGFDDDCQSCSDLGFKTYCNCWAGKWFHVVGTYDGFNVKVHVTGGSSDETLTGSTPACLDPPCGGIVYPSDFHPRAGAPTATCTRSGAVPVVIGNFTDRTIFPGESIKGSTFPHVGAIKQVTIYKDVLSRQQAVRRFNEHRDLWESPMHWQRHWIKSDGISPSIDYVRWEAAGSTQLTVRGLFRTDKSYSCVFRDLNGPARNVSRNATALYAGVLRFAGRVNNEDTDADKKFGNSDTLQCSTPAWQRGFARTRLEVWEDGRPLWQKICIAGECGHSTAAARISGTDFPSQYVAVVDDDPVGTTRRVPCPGRGTACARAVLSPAVHGTRTIFHFTAPSSLWSFEQSNWTGNASLAQLTVQAAGRGYLPGKVVLAASSSVRSQGDFGFTPRVVPEVLEYVPSFLARARVDPSDGAVARADILEIGEEKPPGNPGLVPVIVYDDDCAMDSAECGQTQQTGTITHAEIRREYHFMCPHPEVPNNCSTCQVPAECPECSCFSGCSNGTSWIDTVRCTGGSCVKYGGAKIRYSRHPSWMTITSLLQFVTPEDRGTFSSGQGISLMSSQDTCLCNGSRILDACIDFRIAEGAEVSIAPGNVGLQKWHNLWGATSGVLGKQACRTVPGCAADPRSTSDYGALSTTSFRDNSSSLAVLVSANYFIGQDAGVNSSVFVLDPLSASPALVQSVPSFGATESATVHAGGATYLALANFRGPSMLYRWTRASSPILALGIAAPGVGYVGGNVRVASRLLSRGNGFAAAFTTDPDTGAIASVDVSDAGSDYLPGVAVEPVYLPGCAVDDSGCADKAMTGSVTNVRVLAPAEQFGNCSAGDSIEGRVNGIAVFSGTLAWGDGNWSVQFPDAQSRGSGLASSAGMTIGARGSNCSCGTGADLGDLTACLAPVVACGSSLAVLPHSGVAVGVDTILTVAAGNDYVEGIVRVHGTSHGSGFRAEFSVGGDGAVDIVSVVSRGHGYFPDASVGLYYGPRCAVVDDDCERTPMGGSVTRVALMPGTSAANCTKGGVVQLSGGTGGAGFRAVFRALPSGRISGIYFEAAGDHGHGYARSSPGAVVVTGGAGCYCVNSSGTILELASCLQVSVAGGADVLPHPQAALRDHHCGPGTLCRDVSARDAVHRLAPRQRSALDMPLDLSRPLVLPADGAVGVAGFNIGNASFVALACYSVPVPATAEEVPGPARSVLFGLDPSGEADPLLRVRRIQFFDTAQARDVVAFVDPVSGATLLFFSQDGAESLLYRWTPRLGAFALVQRVPTASARTLSFFEASNSAFVLVAQGIAPLSVMLRFNGTHLQELQTTSFLASNAAGGQAFESSFASAAITWERTGEHFMLLANSRNCSIDATYEDNSPVSLRDPRSAQVDADGCSRTEVWSTLRRRVDQDRVELARPVDAALAPDGRFMYVAATDSQAIAVFERDAASGRLRPRRSLLHRNTRAEPDRKDPFGPAPGRALQRTLEGLAALEMSPDGRFLYAAAASAGHVLVFSREAQSGALTLVQELRDGSIVAGRLLDALGGARALALANGTLYVAAQADAAVSVFDVDAEAGTLTYVDRLREGERLVGRFAGLEPLERFGTGANGTTVRLPAPPPSFKASVLPRKLVAHARDHGQAPWANRTKASSSVRIDGVLYLAVVRADSAEAEGQVAIFRWDAEEMEFALMQATGSRDLRPVDAEFFSLQAPGAADRHFLVVANAESEANVYTWAPATSSFVWYHALSFALPDGRVLPPFDDVLGVPPCARGNVVVDPLEDVVENCSTATDAADVAGEANTSMASAWATPFLTIPEYQCVPTAMAQRLRVFKSSGSIFVAVAYVWDQPQEEGYKWYSVIWRWNRNGIVVLADGSSLPGAGFQLYQVLPTSGAVDVEFVDAGAGARLLVVANLLSPDTPDSYESTVTVWLHLETSWNSIVRGEAGRFELIQSIPATGAYSLAAFTVPAREDEPGPEHCMLGIAKLRVAPGNYSSTPEVHRWDPLEKRFVLHQEFPDNGAVAAMTAIREGEEAHLVLLPITDGLAACDASGRSCSAAEGDECNIAEVLQWDRAAQRFDQLMSITDTDYKRLHGVPVPHEERRIHEWPLPLPVRSVVHASVVFTGDGGPVLLVLSSLVDGALLMEWDFERAVGLQGAGPLAADPQGGLVFVAGGADAALSLLERGEEPDARGEPVMLLRWREAWAEGVLHVSRTRVAKRHGADGLAGARRVSLAPPNCSIVAPHGRARCTGVRVEADPPRHNLPCGPMPPVRPTVEAAKPWLELPAGVWMPARCVETNVSVSLTSENNPDLFSSAPAIAVAGGARSSGALSFSTNYFRHGTSVFSAVSRPGSGIVRPFSVTVLPVRYRPAFTANDLKVNEAKNDYRYNMMFFASDVSSGDEFASVESRRALQWSITNTSRCPQAFGTSPTLHFVQDLANTVVNEGGRSRVYGVVRFRWNKHVSGRCEVGVVLKDPESGFESEEQYFAITALAINDPPAITIASSCISTLQSTSLAYCARVVVEGKQQSGVKVDQGAGPQRVKVIHSLSWQPDPRPDECTVECPCSSQGFCAQTAFCRTNASCWFSLEVDRVERQVEDKDVIVGYPGWDENKTSPFFKTLWVQDDDILLNAGFETTGELLFEANPERFGIFRITSRAVDAGGTELGGIDAATKTFLIEVVPVVQPVSFGAVVDADAASLSEPVDTGSLIDALLGTVDTGMATGGVRGWAGVDISDVRSVPVSAVNLTILEQKRLLPQAFPRFFAGLVNGPPEQQALASLTVRVGNVSRPSLFLHNASGNCTGCPALNMSSGDSADLSFTLAPFMYGVASVQVTFVSKVPWSASTAERTVILDIIVLPLNDPPSAELTTWIGLAEDSPPVEIHAFATGISVGPANEGWQLPIFSIEAAPDTPGLLAPGTDGDNTVRISANGTLSLALTPGAHGTIELAVGLRDSGGAMLGGRDTAPGFPRAARIKVFPRPRITSVTPCVGPFAAGRTVTIIGQYFGSDYTAAPAGFPAESFNVTVGSEPCLNVTRQSDTRILCSVPYGQGRRPVVVRMHGGTARNAIGDALSADWSRGATFEEGVEAVQALYGGGLVSRDAPSRDSLLALGPVVDEATEAERARMWLCFDGQDDNGTALAAPVLDEAEKAACSDVRWNPDFTPPTARVVSGLPTVKTIRAIAPYRGRVFLGGSFEIDDAGADRARFYIGTWDGAKLQSVGAGLDGTLYALEPFGGRLIVGGAFTQAYPDSATGAPGIRTGGLAAWNGTHWSQVGGVAMRGGVVTVATAVKGRLYIGGRFSQVGDMSARNIAVFDGAVWKPLGSGLVSRDVWAIAANDVGVFVGGDISHAGGLQVGNLARWDPVAERWTGMREIAGVVRALVAFDMRLFIGGDFTQAGTLPVASLAQYVASNVTQDVEWKTVGAGVVGSVFVMTKIRNCIYIGGVFSAVADQAGVQPAANAARWCVRANATQYDQEGFEPVRGIGTAGAQIMAITEMVE